MTHRCLNCLEPMVEEIMTPDGLFCLSCFGKVGLRSAFYEVIKALDGISRSFLKFENGGDCAEVRMEDGKAVLAVSYDKEDKDYTIYIEFSGTMIFLVGRKTITNKTVGKIMKDHGPIFDKYIE